MVSPFPIGGFEPKPSSHIRGEYNPWVWPKPYDFYGNLCIKVMDYYACLQQYIITRMIMVAPYICLNDL